jgi:hypothetical protein
MLHASLYRGGIVEIGNQFQPIVMLTSRKGAIIIGNVQCVLLFASALASSWSLALKLHVLLPAAAIRGRLA